MTASRWIQRILPVRYRRNPDEGMAMMKQIHDLAWPATVESIFVSLVGMVDTVMVSTLGTTAIAAVGLCSQPRFIAQSFTLSLNVAVTALISRRVGQQNYSAASHCLRQALLCSGFIAFLVCGASALFARPYLMLAGGNDQTIDMAVSYFQIAMIAQFFQALSTTITTAQRSGGNSRISMQANVTANVVNIILNYLWIGGHFGFEAMGVTGAALATLVGSMAGCLMALISVLRRNSALPLHPRQSWRFQRETLRLLSRISAAAFLEQFCLRLGGFLYARLAAGLGTESLATHQICVDTTNILFSFFDGYVAAAAALTGRMMGASRPERAKDYVDLGCRMALVLAVVLMVATLLLKRPILRLFTDDLLILAQGEQILTMCALLLGILALRMIWAGALRGAGDTRFVALSTFFSMTLLRPLLAWLFSGPLGLGLMGIWMALAADFLLRWLMSGWRYRSGRWMGISF